MNVHNNPRSQSILDASTDQLVAQLFGCEPGSTPWKAITAEIQRRQLNDLGTSLERAERLSEALSQHMTRLIAAVESTDRQTRTLRRLTWGVSLLSVALLFFTVVLAKDTRTLVQREIAQQSHELLNTNPPPILSPKDKSSDNPRQ